MIVESLLATIVGRIVALYDPDAIYVFGSHSRGTATEKSDLDLLVVRPSELPHGLRGRNVTAALREFALDFDVLFLTPDELAEAAAEPHSLVAAIFPTAKKVFERSHDRPAVHVAAPAEGR